MATIFPDAFVPLSPTVPLSATAAVIGYDRRLQQPVLDIGAGPVVLSDIQRGAWDAGEEAFTDEQQRRIAEAVQYIAR